MWGVRRWGSATSSSSFRRMLPLSTSTCCSRSIVHPVTAKSFDPEVMQSMQAVCLVFHIPHNAACQQLISVLDQLAEQLNIDAGAAWLKLCAVDGDVNRNLASALSVQRSQLPVTFFINQGSIIDKLIGNVPEQRIEAILRKFHDHYHATVGADLQGEVKGIPIAAAAAVDLTSGAPTMFLQKKILASLAGADMIRLPEEAAQMEGIKKLIQQTKQRAFAELEELHHSVGMDVKRLSDEEMEKEYFSTEVYECAVMMTALEALFLARTYGSIGIVDAKVPQNALDGLQRDFPRGMSFASVKKVMVLIHANIIRGKYRETSLKLQQELQSSGGDPAVAERVAAETQYIEKVRKWIDFVDTRRALTTNAGGTSGQVSDFPTEMVDEMLQQFRLALVGAKKSEVLAQRAAEVRQLLTGVLLMFPQDPQTMTTRTRMSSMMF